MQRATKLFLFDETRLSSPIVEKIWRTRSEPVHTFISVAVRHWEMVVTRLQDRTYLTMRGPETKATMAPIPQDAEFFGIQFELGTFMPDLPLDWLADGGLTLPKATGASFWLNGSAWPFPDYHNADVFVDRLVRKGLIVRDPLVQAALQGHESALTVRSVQRRFLRATGLTYRTHRQIERAYRAVDLLERGVPILDAAEQAGYADQPHLTRSLKRFIGQTPAQIVRENDRDGPRRQGG